VALKTATKAPKPARLPRLSLCQMRRLRDRPRCHGQLYAFNTAAGEKINADNRLKDLCIGLNVSGYGKISL
jgi:hypothetical protein